MIVPGSNGILFHSRDVLKILALFDDVTKTVFLLKNPINPYLPNSMGNHLSRVTWISNKLDMDMPYTCGDVNRK